MRVGCRPDRAPREQSRPPSRRRRIASMAATSVSAAKNRMARAVESIIDPWPSSIDPIWDFFGSECAYCGVKLVKGERLGHIDHATSKAGNHMGNLVLACSVCNGDE